MAKSNLTQEKNTSYPIPPFDDLTMLVFGQPGTGKTTFCSKAPGTKFFSTEPGTEFLEADSIATYNWQIFADEVDRLCALKFAISKGEVDKSEWKHKSFCIDIVDNLAQMCRDHVCKGKGLAYPPTNDFGKTWSEITNMWKDYIKKLLILGNVRFISHCTTQEHQVVNEENLSEDVNRFVPTFFGSKTAQYLDGIVNLQGYCAVNKKGQYCVTFRQQATVSAKDRTGLLAGFGALPLDWDIVNDAYEAKAKELGKTILSRRSF